ncbi:MAG: c-type cytochrome [Polyangiaceae bacterium]|nr:c-type cytochrome [Polyangiaceae bacterium]
MSTHRAPMLSALFASAMLAACGGPSAGGPTTPARSYEGPIASTDVMLGQRIYETHCSSCHPGASAGYGPAIAGLGWQPAQMRQTVREGKGRMPAFGPEKISDEELEALLAHLSGTGSVVAAP